MGVEGLMSCGSGSGTRARAFGLSFGLLCLILLTGIYKYSSAHMKLLSIDRSGLAAVERQLHQHPGGYGVCTFCGRTRFRKKKIMDRNT